MQDQGLGLRGLRIGDDFTPPRVESMKSPENLGKNILELQYLEIYSYADLAAGKDAKNKAHGARQAIVTAARDWYDRWFFLQTWAGRETTTDFKEKILETQRTYKPRLFGLEANGMQVLFGSLVREAAKLEFGNIKMIPVYQPTNVEKNFRIRTGLEPLIAQGRLFMLGAHTDAWAELRGFPTAATKDIVDAMETCVRMAPKRPIGKRMDAKEAQYAKYLRSSRLPAHLIEKKLEGFRKLRLDN